ncbi:DUF3514 domain-containing protein [Ehrlichia japonica]|uniref:DUF3514 domain-containing protein n=1 Tax=Ehrlichia japonica TaxID=391036 RepID=UPI0009FF624A
MQKLIAKGHIGKELLFRTVAFSQCSCSIRRAFRHLYHPAKNHVHEISGLNIPWSIMRRCPKGF